MSTYRQTVRGWKNKQGRLSPNDLYDHSAVGLTVGRLFATLPITEVEISWGEPAVITQVTMDKECPCCGLSRADGFDMGVERGRVFGARCPREDGGCGWSF